MEELLNLITQKTDTKQASTYFVNGVPGSGKSTLLRQTAEKLPKYVPNANVLGPYFVDSHYAFTNGIIRDCQDYSFIDQSAPDEILGDMVSTWRWLQKNIKTPRNQTLAVFVDFDYSQSQQIETLQPWMSGLRSLEQSWAEPYLARLIVVFSSYWNPAELSKWYTMSGFSFPYTSQYNYYVSPGISADMVQSLVQRFFPKSTDYLPFDRLLHEITNGHPGAIVELLSHMTVETLTVPGIIATVQKIAQTSQTTQQLLQIWQRLSPHALTIVQDVLLFKQIPVKACTSHLETLQTAGLVRLHPLGKEKYVRLYSWFVELVLREHLDVLGLDSPELTRINLRDLAIPSNQLNLEAYQLINEIETLGRNFVVAFLSQHPLNGQQSILSDRVVKYSQQKGGDEDAHERATFFQDKERRDGLLADTNPLISYLTTSHLAELLDDIGQQFDFDDWKAISQNYEKITPIRNAVMHNRLIDEKALETLYTLRTQIYAAMRETS